MCHKTHRERLWKNGDAELSKMLVQGDRGVQPQFIHYNFARAIGEAAAGRGALSKQDPGTADLIVRQKMQSGDCFIKELTPDCQCQPWTFPGDEER